MKLALKEINILGLILFSKTNHLMLSLTEGDVDLAIQFIK